MSKNVNGYYLDLKGKRVTIIISQNSRKPKELREDQKMLKKLQAEDIALLKQMDIIQDKTSKAHNELASEDQKVMKRAVELKKLVKLEKKTFNEELEDKELKNLEKNKRKPLTKMERKDKKEHKTLARADEGLFREIKTLETRLKHKKIDKK